MKKEKEKTIYVLELILASCIILLTILNTYCMKYFSYLTGLYNESMVYIVETSCGIIIIGIVLLIIFFGLILTNLTRKKGILTAFLILFIVGSYCWRFATPTYTNHAEGLAHWAKTNVDIEAMLDFLKNVEIDTDNVNGGRYELKKSQLPKSFENIKPVYVTIRNALDENRRQIRFAWGGGFEGPRGVIIGSIEPEDLIFKDGISTEYRLTFHPNGYVFLGIE